jgi:putative endopeptidase
MNKNNKSNKSNKKKRSNRFIKTVKNKFKLIPKGCPITLTPFQQKYIKKINESKKNKISNNQLKLKFTKEITKSFAPDAIKPYNDYYTYINNEWLNESHRTEAQKYIIQVDDFRLVQDRVFIQLYHIINNYTKTNTHHAKMMKNYFHSVLKMNPINESKQLAKEAVEFVDKSLQNGNVWQLLGNMNKNTMINSSAPFSWDVTADEKEPTKFRSFIGGHAFELIDINVYYDDGTDVAYKTSVRNKFFKTCKEIFNTCLGENDLDGKDVYDVEVEIFNTFGCTDITKNPQDYNRVTKEDANKKYGFDWCELSKTIGFKTPPSFFITSNLNYLKCASDLLTKNWQTKKWRTYWIFLMLKRITRITAKWETIIYDFWGKYQRGQEKLNTDPAVSAVLYMTLPFNKFLSDMYVKEYENPQAIKYTKVMCDDLKLVYREILKRNNWLSKKSKDYALYKLEKFNFVIGSHKVPFDDPQLSYTSNLNNNMMLFNDWRVKKLISLDGHKYVDLPLVDWTEYPVKMIGSQPYIVNASYTPTQNTIFINLGYIQKPFIDMDERGIEYNLAGIGNTIAHEMSHGFDDTGSKYGADGKLFDWWSPEDKKKFKAIQKDVTEQYELFAKRDGIKYDAAAAIGENMADISGLQIISMYLRNFQIFHKDVTMISKLSFEVFFTWFAVSQRQKLNKKALALQLKTNPHPPDKYRCNIPLSRLPMFRKLLNVKKGDDMWWHNINSVW